MLCFILTILKLEKYNNTESIKNSLKPTNYFLFASTEFLIVAQTQNKSRIFIIQIVIKSKVLYRSTINPI